VASVLLEISSSQQKLIKISEQETVANLGLGGHITFGFKSFFHPCRKIWDSTLK